MISLHSRLLSLLTLAVLVLTLVACAGSAVRSLAPNPKLLRTTTEADARPATPPPAAARRRAPRSGLYLLAANEAAFHARLAMADAAQKTLDVQYYLFHDDMTGRILMERLIRAADRGVRVRLLVDDFGLLRFDGRLKRLDAHPHIEVRVFNPFRQRANPLGVPRAVEILTDPGRLTRRMHNKLFAIDGRLVVIGGRNVGDAYFTTRFGAYFKDLDVLATGPVVNEARVMFEKFWNSKWAVSPRRFGGDIARARARADLRQWQTTTVQDQATHLADDALEASGWADKIRRRDGVAWIWSPVELIYDRPEKINPEATPAPERRLRPHLAERAAACGKEFLIISAYFVPSREDVAFLRQLRANGVRVAVLTNSLAATDVPAVHGGYARWREEMVRAGVELYELKPNARLGSRWRVRRRGTSRTSLHAKAYVFDGREVFVGSFNADPRSAALNTEMGLLTESPALAAQVRALFLEAIRPAASYRLAVDERGRLVWHSAERGQPVTRDREPEAGMWRHFMATLAGLLPIEDQL